MSRPLSHQPRRRWIAGVAVLAAALVAQPAPGEPPMAREIRIPYDSLHVVLQGQPERVTLPRDQYEALLAKAVKSPPTTAPQPALITAADYQVTVDEGRAIIKGTLLVEALEAGLHALPLDLEGVGLTAARLDDRAAPLGQLPGQAATVFVDGPGRRRLHLEMLAPVETAAARQTLRFRLPRPAAVRMTLTAAGDVEIKSGAEVISRTVDGAAKRTRFELLPPQSTVTLVMTLNSRLLRQDRAVIARSVQIAEVTQAYERLHATTTLEMLHRAGTRFQWDVPEGFEVTSVASPAVARWTVIADAARRVLEVELREAASDAATLSIVAFRSPARLDAWNWPQLTPRDVIGHASVLGLLAETRLRTEAIEAADLLSIDVDNLRKALPDSIFLAEPGAAALAPAAAFYAPRAGFRLAARFVKPPADVTVVGRTRLMASEKGLEAGGQFTIVPEAERLFGFDFTAPAEWQITGVQGPDGKPLKFDRSPDGPQRSRIHVVLPQSVPVKTPYNLAFRSDFTPPDWLKDGARRTIEYPRFAPLDAAKASAYLAAATDADYTVRPAATEGLRPLDAAEAATGGFNADAASLVYYADGRDYRATLLVERGSPRVTARTFSFFRLDSESLAAHYELIYAVENARVNKLALLLPEATPLSLTVKGMAGLRVKESSSAPAKAGFRRWDVLLEDSRRGELRLAVDLQMPLGGARLKDLSLPLVRAADAVHQSGLVSVEAAAEIDLTVAAHHARKVDVGELADAEYQPGRRLVGAYEFVAEGATVLTDVRASVVRQPAAALPSALVEDARFDTLVSAEGVSLTTARFSLQTKSLLLQVKLPPDSTLWSVLADDRPLAPQTEGGATLVVLPAAAHPKRQLTVVYETPVRCFPAGGRLGLPGPELALWVGKAAAAVPVPLADLHWRIALPQGYRLVKSEGTVVSPTPRRPVPAIWTGMRLIAGAIVLPAGTVREAPRRPAASMAKPTIERELMETAAEDKKRDQLSLRKPAAAAKAEKSKAAAVELKAARPGEDSIAVGLSAPGVFSADMAPPFAIEPQAPRKQAGPELLGFRSLKIDTAEAAAHHGPVIEFTSLGANPRLDITLASQARSSAWVWSLGLTVFLWGLRRVAGPLRPAFRYALLALALGTLVPLPFDQPLAVELGNTAVIGGLTLLPAWIVVRMLRPLYNWFWRAMTPVASSGVAAAALLAVYGWTACGLADETPPPGKYVVQVIDAVPPPPAKIPDDAILIPYDVEKPSGGVERVLIPQKKYEELWNQAYPEDPLKLVKLPADYALAGAAYSGTLGDDDRLALTGVLDIDVFADSYVSIPLHLAGGVLAGVQLDGKPAQLNAPPPEAKQIAKPPAGDESLWLYVQGKGRHQLTVDIRLHVERRGGWRVVEGRLPAAPAAAAVLRAPQAQTEVLLTKIGDRARHETRSPHETIATTLGAGGTLNVQWRPKAADDTVDAALTVRSSALFDVQEDALRMVCQMQLEFRRAQRTAFEFEAPEGWLIERVEGTNVRGWRVRVRDAVQVVAVDLLETARDAESLTIALSRRGAVGKAGLAEFAAPVVRAVGAAMQTGAIVVRRSPALAVRTLKTTGLTRIDIPPSAAAVRPEEFRVHPLGYVPYEAQRFSVLPFEWRLAAATRETVVDAQFRTVLRMSPHRREVETAATLEIHGSPLHQCAVFAPGDFELLTVSAPGAVHWSTIGRDGRRLLSLRFDRGQTGRTQFVIRGALGGTGRFLEMPLPHFSVLGARNQRSWFAVQTEPAFDVEAVKLRNCKPALLDDFSAWLNPQQRPTARTALATLSSDYAGLLRLRARNPRVSCVTVSNVRITPRAIEETVLLDFTVEDAGIRELSFQLPPSVEEPRISAPMLREKSVRRTSDKPDAPWQVRLQFQDARMGQVRVLAQSDAAVAARQRRVAVPLVETGRTVRQFVTLESSGRDEVRVEQAAGFEPLDRQQPHWTALRAYLGDKITLAYAATPGAAKCELVMQWTDRQAVETAGASIWLADACLTLDANGAYRAAVTYRMNNATEQFLSVELPADAALWTAHVAGEPVKPIVGAGADGRRVRVPLVKTAEGERDYAVTLTYAGKGPALELWNGVDFPLVRTLNVKAARSLLSLHLPADQRWFHFSDGMSQLSDADEADEYRRATDVEQAKRLLDTAQHGAAFAKARAGSALSQLGDFYYGAAESTRALGRAGGAGPPAEAEVAQQVKEQLARQQAQPQQAAVDNRGMLSQAYSYQRNLAATALQSQGVNFAPPALSQPAAAASQNLFNEIWIGGNALGNAEPKEPEKRRAPESLGRRLKEDRDGKERRAEAGEKRGIQWRERDLDVAQNAALSGGVPFATAGKPAAQAAGQPQSPANAVSDYREANLLGRYKQKLDLNAGNLAVAALPTDALAKGTERQWDADAQQRSDSRVSPAAGGVTIIQPPKASGLASLDVEIPRRGQAFYFTAPHGDVHLSARSVSQDVAGRAMRSGLGLLGLALLAGLIRFSRTRKAAP